MKMVVDVRSILRLALGSFKDHASIGKAVIFRRRHDILADVEVAIVRATTHDNSPIDERFVHEILFLVSNSPSSVAFLARRISRRIDKTQDRTVALKTLLLVHRLLRGGDRNFEQDLRHTYLCGYLYLNLHCFPRNSDSFTLFLHDYAAFIEERMSWVINQAGKLEPILSHGSEFQFHEEKSMEMVFFKLPRCQAFLDRIMDCSPLTNNVTHIDLVTRVALINILRESFQIYASFSEAITTLVDSFFDFNKPERTVALDIFRRASSQSYKLFEFFENCKRITGTKNLEYPSIRVITVDCVSTMEELMSCSQQAFGKGCSLFAMIDSPSSATFDTAHQKPAVRSPELSIKGEEVMEVITSSILDSPFSCKLETKISTEWVEFDEEDSDQNFRLLWGIGNKSPNYLADERWWENLELKQERPKPYYYYNPFIDPVDVKQANFMRG